MATDLYEHDPGMRDLHRRDLRNSATPVHRPVVQGVDLDAADDDDRLDDAVEQPEPPEGDADFAVAAKAEVDEQVEAQSHALDHIEQPEDEAHDNTPPAGDDESSPVNAFGNVAPEHAQESQMDGPPNREDDPETKHFDESAQTFKADDRG